MNLKFNKGEWSEFYTFIKILSDGRLPLADSKMNNRNSEYLQVLAVLNNNIDYTRSENNITFVFEDDVISIPVKKFKENSELLLNAILNSKGRTFEVESASHFANTLHIDSLKQSSRKKGDIKIKVHDAFTNADLVQNFSVKSYLGSKPTLLNASNGTIIKYKVLGNEVSDEEINEINTCSSHILDRLNLISKKGLKIVYDDMNDATFKENLQMIDTNFPELLAELYLSSYYIKGKALNKVVPYYLDKNTSANKKIITYNVKEFLISIALGMVPKTAWSGLDEANGGYIVVKKDGEIVCYYIYDRNDLKQYLYDQTHFDTPSSKRTNLGMIERENDGSLSFNLTVQIRFK